jgi:hypothetical protein
MPDTLTAAMRSHRNLMAHSIQFMRCTGRYHYAVGSRPERRLRACRQLTSWITQSAPALKPGMPPVRVSAGGGDLPAAAPSRSAQRVDGAQPVHGQPARALPILLTHGQPPRRHGLTPDPRSASMPHGRARPRSHAPARQGRRTRLVPDTDTSGPMRLQAAGKSRS